MYPPTQLTWNLTKGPPCGFHVDWWEGSANRLHAKFVHPPQCAFPFAGKGRRILVNGFNMDTCICENRSTPKNDFPSGSPLDHGEKGYSQTSDKQTSRDGGIVLEAALDTVSLAGSIFASPGSPQNLKDASPFLRFACFHDGHPRQGSLNWIFITFWCPIEGELPKANLWTLFPCSGPFLIMAPKG